MSRRSDARPDGGGEVLGLFPTSPVRRSVEATSGATRCGVAAIGRSARSWRAALPGVGLAGLVGGLFGPWFSSSYFGVGRVSAGVVDLPGGPAYAAAVAVFVIGVAGGGARARPGRVALLVLAAGLAAYSAFWLLGTLALDLKSGFPGSDPTFGVGVLLSVTGTVLSAWVVRASARPTPVTQPGDEGHDLILPNQKDGRSSEFVSCEQFLDRLRSRWSAGEGHENVPLVFVRLDGLDEVRRRYGSPAADRVMAGMAHRLRAHLRQDDTVVRFAPAEVFILLSGEVSEENALVVVRRLKTVLALPIPSVKRRHAELVQVTVELGRARLMNGRLHVVVDGDRLIDAPITTATAAGADALGPPPLRSPRSAT